MEIIMEIMKIKKHRMKIPRLHRLASLRRSNLDPPSDVINLLSNSHRLARRNEVNVTTLKVIY